VCIQTCAAVSSTLTTFKSPSDNFTHASDQAVEENERVSVAPSDFHFCSLSLLRAPADNTGNMLAGQQRLQRPCSAQRAAVARPCAIKRSRIACRASSDRFPAQVCIVLGTQWGDEGKGKLVDILAQQYDVIARAQVSSGRSSSVAAQQLGQLCLTQLATPVCTAAALSAIAGPCSCISSCQQSQRHTSS
jgi:hypothetical protein